MYGQDSGYKGWSDAMVVQILELQKRFVNRNYILNEIIGNMVTHYVFHEENRARYPMNTEISLNWARGYYQNVYAPNEKYISETLFNQIAANCLAGHNIESKGIIPSMTLTEFMEEMKKPIEHLPNEETCGATPAGYIAPNVSPDWPCTINDYFDDVEPPMDVDSDTNHSRYGGMKQAIGVPLSESDYDMTYDGTPGSESIKVEKKDESNYDEARRCDTTSINSTTFVSDDSVTTCNHIPSVDDTVEKRFLKSLTDIYTNASSMDTSDTSISNQIDIFTKPWNSDRSSTTDTSDE